MGGTKTASGGTELALRNRKVTQTGGALPPGTAGEAERIAERQTRAMSLRLAGGSYAAIARTLLVSKQQAWRDVKTALAESLNLRDEDANTYREIELLRLDEMTVALWPAVRRGEPESCRAALRISERRAALLGLDAAVASRVEVMGGRPITVRHEARPYADMTNEQLLERVDLIRRSLEAGTPPEPTQPPEPPHVDPVAAYAAVLAARRRGEPDVN